MDAWETRCGYDAMDAIKTSAEELKKISTCLGEKTGYGRQKMFTGNIKEVQEWLARKLSEGDRYVAHDMTHDGFCFAIVERREK